MRASLRVPANRVELIELFGRHAFINDFRIGLTILSSFARPSRPVM